ncbi:DUF3016 domain-containing protein [Duganella phyllosphaerae]|uniref:DUF3016 domain-containing protein n=1 Tax=Duganella phyllosphaerae TaxID=762836 RepID=A0A1E7WY71_9BURK|nr:DUF3016 domain-containing protein [Duganella phyllosphaerae]OFA04753.1 hypothetical protein DUPY_16390 [Duganella phyllosphaerae]
MRLKITSALAALLVLAATTGAAWAQVSVSYVKPDEFIDMPHGQIERDRVLKEFTQYFATFDKKLPAGQQLKIEVLDIDLAGRLWPRRSGGDDIRIMNGGADWPHMKLRYTLEENGAVLRSGESDLSNMMYQQRATRLSDSDPMRYEKQMIDDWFEKTILPKVAAK